MKQYTKHLLSAVTATIFILLFCFSATQKPVVLSSIKTPSYDYKSPESPNPQKIALALIKPSFVKSMKASELQIFTEFADRLGMDFEEMVTNRGYTLRGPFSTSDDMVYNDKVNCPLMLQPEILIDFDLSNIKPNAYTKYNAVTKINTTTYGFEGFLIMKGSLNMIFSEPFTKEKIKTRSISLPQKNINILSEGTNYNTDNLYNMVRWGKEPGIQNPIIIGMEDYYQQCLKTAYNHLDPDEVKEYTENALKARKDRK
jgi:hypothetical protein